MTTRIDLLLDRIQQRLYLIRDLQIRNDLDRYEIKRIEGKDKKHRNLPKGEAKP